VRHTASNNPSSLLNSRGLEQTPQASWFRDVGPDHLEIAAGISGSSSRIAMAFETDERKLMPTVARRLATPQPIVEVSWADAPVHARVVTGDSVDLTKLPFYLQHELDPVTGKRWRRCEALRPPFVRSVTNNILVPADCEVVLEGYLDAEGYREMDGPYGEFWGYYGAMHIDLVFHATAIAMRADALHQSVVHGGHGVGTHGNQPNDGRRLRARRGASAAGRRHRGVGAGEQHAVVGADRERQSALVKQPFEGFKGCDRQTRSASNSG
jgi:hypothetical protein